MVSSLSLSYCGTSFVLGVLSVGPALRLSFIPLPTSHSALVSCFRTDVTPQPLGGPTSSARGELRWILNSSYYPWIVDDGEH